MLGIKELSWRRRVSLRNFAINVANLCPFPELVRYKQPANRQHFLRASNRTFADLFFARYLKSVFPTVEEYLLLDVLSNSDNNVQKGADRLVKMGYVKRDTPSTYYVKSLRPRISANIYFPLLAQVLHGCMLVEKRRKGWPKSAHPFLNPHR